MSNGLLCPNCGSHKSKVIGTEPDRNRIAQKRRRMCLECDERYSTIEIRFEQYKELVQRDKELAMVEISTELTPHLSVS